MPLKPDTLALTAVLALLTALGPLSTDMYLPSLPAIRAGLGRRPARAQLTLSAFLLGFAVGQFVYGPVSDRVGRQPGAAVRAGLFSLASFICASRPLSRPWSPPASCRPSAPPVRSCSGGPSCAISTRGRGQARIVAHGHHHGCGARRRARLWREAHHAVLGMAHDLRPDAVLRFALAATVLLRLRRASATLRHVPISFPPSCEASARC